MVLPLDYSSEDSSPNPLDRNDISDSLADLIALLGLEGGLSTSSQPPHPYPSPANSENNGVSSSKTELEQAIPEQPQQSIHDEHAAAHPSADRRPTNQPASTAPTIPLNAVSKSEHYQNGHKTDLQSLVDQLESKVTRIERQLYEPTDLINPLLPLIRELLSLKSTESSEAILQKLVPLIDEAIRLRAEQAQDKMGLAIASVLPTAIAQEIQNSPTAIAKALAPEIAIAIQEQTKLDPTGIAGALGPQMGEAIKQQIVVERDAMVDALYPVIGNTISKYMVEVVKSINDKVESSLSPEGIWRKIRARIKGVSEAELILQESLKFKIRAILLIHKSSGLVIREILPASDFQVESSMLAGMLTAIRNFVNDCIGDPNEDTELHEIEYDASKIILEVAGYCYLAVVVKGEPSKPFIEKIRDTLGQIVLKADKTIAHYNGEPETVPRTIDALLDELLQSEPKPHQAKVPTGILILLGMILIPTLFLLYRGYIAHQAIAKAAEALDAAPELSIYRVVPKVHWGTLTLTGRLPNDRLRRQAQQVVHQATPDWPLKNQIIAVQVPAEPTTTAGEIERLTWVYNQKPGMALKTHHEFGSDRVLVTGIATTQKDVEQLAQALNQIPGIAFVTSTVQIRPVLETRIYFEPNTAQIQSSENLAKLKFIRQFLDQNPEVHLKIIGHSDQTGTESRNKTLSLQRAKSIQQWLIAEGVTPTRLTIAANSSPPPDVTTQQPLWLGRSVRFEVFIPSKLPE